MRKVRIIISQIGQQDLFPAQQVPGNFPENLVGLVKGRLDNPLAERIDDLTAAPETEGCSRFFSTLLFVGFFRWGCWGDPPFRELFFTDTIGAEIENPKNA